MARKRRLRFSIFHRRENQENEDDGKTGKDTARKIEAGQKSRPSLSLYLRPGRKIMGIVPRRNIIYDVDVEQLKRLSTSTLLKNLVNISPEASMALWIFMRLCSDDTLIHVTDLKGNDFPRGQAYIDEVVARISHDRGGFQTLEGQFFRTTYTQAATAPEVVLMENLRDTKDIVAVDPGSITFFEQTEEDGTIRYIPKQMGGGQGGWVSLDKQGFYYVPMDPDIGDPYGVSPQVSMLQVVFFDLQILADLQRVTHNQGNPRLHFKVVEKIIAKNAPVKIQNNPKALRKYIEDYLDKLQIRIDKMEPDDSYLTTDATEIEEKGGSGKSAISAKILMDLLKSKIANGLKTLSIFLNMHTGKTESWGSIEWMIQIASVDSIRRVVKSGLDSALTFALQVKGLQGKVSRIYKPIPLYSRKQAEEADLAKTRRILLSVKYGIIGPDEAAKELFGIEKATGEPMLELDDTLLMRASAIVGPEETAARLESVESMIVGRGWKPEDRTRSVSSAKNTMATGPRGDRLQTVKRSKVDDLIRSYERDLERTMRRTTRQVEDVTLENLELEGDEE